MMPEKFNNKTNGITQRRFLLHGNPLLASWVTEKIGTDKWITDLPLIKGIEKYADDPKAQKEFMEIKYKNKLRLAKYIKEHNNIDVDPNSIFDVQVKRLHEYKRQLLNIMHVMYLYNKLKADPSMDFYPTTFIFGAKAAAGYKRAKETIKLIRLRMLLIMIRIFADALRLYLLKTIVYLMRKLSLRQVMFPSRFLQQVRKLPVQAT